MAHRPSAFLTLLLTSDGDLALEVDQRVVGVLEEPSLLPGAEVRRVLEVGEKDLKYRRYKSVLNDRPDVFLRTDRFSVLLHGFFGRTACKEWLRHGGYRPGQR